MASVTAQAFTGDAKLARTRNPDATRKRILRAAKTEFAKQGLDGARVDTIALRAKANKAMIYHYFGSKDDLFRAVLEEAYADIEVAERKLDLEALDPLTAMTRLVEFSWDYYLNNPEFLAIVASENLNRAKHIEDSKVMKTLHRIGPVQALLDRGVKAGVFRPGVDAVQLRMTVAAINAYYFTNRFTREVMYERNFMRPAMLKARLAFNIETILCLVRAARTS